MTSGTEGQFPPAGIHPFLEARTTPIATSATTAVVVSVSFNNRLSHDLFMRGSARLIRSLARASEDCVSAEEVAIDHLHVEYFPKLSYSVHSTRQPDITIRRHVL